MWDPFEPLSTVWHFPCQLSVPCGDSWQGLSCSWNMNHTACDIKAIGLSYRRLAGSLPSELGNLLNLDQLNLEHNLINGTIPSELGNLVNLNLLALQHNSLAGAIPSELSGLVNLEVLHLYENSLNGTIPSELGLLENLIYMSLLQNSLDGTIPSELGNLVNLEALYLCNNSLYGTIPSELGNLVNLGLLYMYGNSLDGTIPPELALVEKLTYLSLLFNSLDGTIPTELGNLVKLKNLELQDNSLEGPIPSELGRLVNLGTLYLYANSLDGTIPTEIGSLVNLVYLGLYDNRMDGTIPTELGSLTNVGLFCLYTNLLDGTIPSELGNIVHVSSLVLCDNFLGGSIPSELGSLLRMELLDLHENSLEGTIPSALGNLFRLELLYLYSNSLDGSIPSELGSLRNLKGMFLHDNLLEAFIPSELGSIVNLQLLYLNNNFLVGTIPCELGNLVKLLVLDLNDNSLTGTLPPSASQWSALQSANLSTNRLSGPVEAFSTNSFLSLYVLDLSLNRFSGTLPESLFSLPKLHTVILSQNCFIGSLPTAICLNDKLQNVIFDLLTGNCAGVRDNVFRSVVLLRYMSGTIPPCIWNSSSLRTLHLLGNGLKGSLSELADDSALSVLAVGSNQLTGTIPLSFQTHNFEQLDLSINRLTGRLASDLYVNQTTTVYDLSVNRLSGGIPGALHASFIAGVVNVLEGNLFSCQQNNIPSSDVSHSSYQCGSVDLQYAIVAWAVGFVVCTATILMIISRTDGAMHKVYKTSDFLGVLVSPVYCLGLCLFGLVGLVTTKLSEDYNDTTTHVVQYWWTVTAVFAHNWVIASFLLLVVIAACVIFTMALLALAREKQITSTPNRVATSTALCLIAVHSVNIIVVTAVNAVYILAAVGNFNGTALLAVQGTLGIFKLAWSTQAIPWLLTHVPAGDPLQLSHRIFMILFVFLGAPFASSFCESSSCFLYVLKSPSPISFSLLISTVSFQSFCDQFGCLIFPVPVKQTFQGSIPPPWIYSYQCSSAVITGYAPVLFLSYLVSSIIIPSIILLTSILLPRWPVILKNTLLVFELIYVDDSSVTVLLDKMVLTTLGRRMAVKYILNLAVMMTFGLAVPVLAVAVIWDTASNLGTVLLLLEKFVGLCERNRLDVAEIRQEFWNGFILSSEDVSRCVYTTLGYVSVFWSLFAFDWIADVYGSLAGGLTMLVPLIAPTLVGFILLNRKKLSDRPTISRQRTENIELSVVESPIVQPQLTNDDF
jgi:Leucine-rich repeat (LRR) protein